MLFSFEYSSIFGLLQFIFFQIANEPNDASGLYLCCEEERHQPKAVEICEITSVLIGIEPRIVSIRIQIDFFSLHIDAQENT
jgi:hypothetical protein